MTSHDAEHPNATAYRRAAAAFRAGTIELIKELVDADVVWHVPGGFWLREHDVFGNDAHMCALSEMGATRPGVDVSTRVVSIFHFSNGKQVERWFYPEDMDAWNTILGAS